MKQTLKVYRTHYVNMSNWGKQFSLPSCQSKCSAAVCH